MTYDKVCLTNSFRSDRGKVVLTYTLKVRERVVCQQKGLKLTL
jgi:hypothetical protein